MEMLPKKSRTNSNPANITTKMISAANTYPAYVNDKPETNAYISVFNFLYLFKKKRIHFLNKYFDQENIEQRQVNLGI